LNRHFTSYSSWFLRVLLPARPLSFRVPIRVTTPSSSASAAGGFAQSNVIKLLQSRTMAASLSPMLQMDLRSWKIPSPNATGSIQSLISAVPLHSLRFISFQLFTLRIISPTHNRTEGRAPVWSSEFTSKVAALHGGVCKIAARLNAKLWTSVTGGGRILPPSRPILFSNPVLTFENNFKSKSKEPCSRI
jgi:hypothetical protein